MATPDWYNDESDPALARWHDGTSWTEHVVVKADWEAAGHPPPPPDEELEGPFVPVDPARSSRVRVLVGSAAVVALLVVAGVALADDGGDPDADPTPAERGSEDDDDRRGFDDLDLDRTTSTDLTDATGDPTVAGSADGDGRSTTGGGSGSGGSTDRTVARAGSTGTTVRSSTSGGVRRTEVSTRSRTDPGPVNQTNGGDQSDVGNTSNTTIIGTVPPTTAAPSTTAAPPPSDGTGQDL